METLQKPSQEIPKAILVSAGYDGEKKKAVIKFYDPETQKIMIWQDSGDHKPYCYSKSSLEDVQMELDGREDIINIVEEEKTSLLDNSQIKVTKIIAKDPLAIGGAQGKPGIREKVEAWEADIKYYENYLYDSRLICGSYYSVENSKPKQIDFEIPPEVEESLKKTMAKADPSTKKHLEEWAKLLSQPLPKLKRVALDIEVISPDENRIPNPEEAEEQVIATAFASSDDRREVLVLRKNKDEMITSVGEGAVFRVFDSEKDLMTAIFETMLEYPFILTYNGDKFDLTYLYNRALKLGFKKKEIPISIIREIGYVKHGIHIDLYRTFHNRSIQIYAFSNKYSEHTLGAISESLLGDTKIKFEEKIGELSLENLAKYCLKDAELTYQLTSFGGDLLCKLLIVLCRVSKMPIDDVSRLGVSNWIRSMLFYEHRLMNALIPKQKELQQKGGASTESIIKGKKYKGAVVIDPKAGIYFDVKVLDFASLYPSIIKVHNLSYETVLCTHEDCRDNIIPGTNNWVCRKKRGISSAVIGALRDLRIEYYKPLSKNSALNKEEMGLYNIVSQALKVILNASYGVMGAEIFPLYCLPVAEATASVGRHIITKTIEKSKDMDIEVIYGDTDSLFLKSPRQEQLEQIITWASSDLGVELDLEKTYRYVAFSQRKKNYMGVLEDGKVDIKGLTGKKSHIPQFIKQAFYNSINILSKVNSPGDFEKAKEDIKKDIREKYLALKQRKIPIEDLAFNVMIGKPLEKYTHTTPQHVRAARLLESKGKKVKAGEIISYIKTNTPPGVKPISMAKISDVDTKKYLEQMRSTFDQFLDALGYDFDGIMGATKLEDFFWGK